MTNRLPYGVNLDVMSEHIAVHSGSLKLTVAMRKMLLLALVLVLPHPLTAQNQIDFKSLSNDQLIARFEQERVRAEPDFCKEISPMTTEMLVRGFVQVEPIHQISAELQCAFNTEKWIEAYPLATKLESETGKSLGAAGLLIALGSGNNDNAANRLEKLLADGGPSAVAEINPDYFPELMRRLRREKNDKALVQMASAIEKSGLFGQFSSSDQSFFATTLIESEGRLGQFERSKVFIPYVRSAYAMQPLLALRRFSSIWPELEEASGQNMKTLIDQQIEHLSARLQTDPDNRKTLQELANTLLFAGKYEQAIDAVGDVGNDLEQLDRLTEDDGWAVNAKAQALDALDREAEAEALYDRLAAIAYTPERTPWLINFVINRAARLVDMGHWQKGLDALTLAEKVAEKSSSPYARALIMTYKGCALHQLGRVSEAKTIAAEAFERRKDAYGAVARLHLCISEPDRAAQLVVEALGDDLAVWAMARDLQPEQFSLFYGRSILPDLREQLFKRDDVSAAYDHAARDIPDRFTPLAGLRRAELARANSQTTRQGVASQRPTQ